MEPQPLRGGRVAGGGVSAQQGDDVGGDIAAPAARAGGIADGQVKQGHCADVTADGLLKGAFLGADFRRHAWRQAPTGDAVNPAAAGQGFADPFAENGGAMVAARRGQGAAMRDEALPKRTAGPGGQSVGADVDHSRAVAAAGTVFAGLEEEIHAGLGPGHSAGGIGQGALPADALFQIP